MPQKVRLLTGHRTLRISAPLSLYLAESALAMMVAGCAILEFNHQVSIDGMSYYGVHRKTIPVLVLGLSVSTFFFLRAARGFDVPGVGHLISTTLRVFPVTAMALLLTPYSVNNYFDLAHKAIGTSLFLWQLALSIPWAIERARDRISWFAVSLQLVGGFAALLSLPHDSLGLQFEGQLLFQIGFFALLNHVSKEIALSRR